MYIALLQADPIVAARLCEILQHAGHTVQTYSNGARLLDTLTRAPPDLYVLDWWAPGRTGLQVLHHLRHHDRSQSPVLFLTPSGNERDVACALDAGADDYCSHPIRTTLLLTRVDALLNKSTRPQPYPGALLHIGYRFEPRDLSVHFHGTRQQLSDKEFRLALLLFEHVGTALARKRLITTLWGDTRNAHTRSLDVHICSLRRKLNLSPHAPHAQLQAVYGFGYRLNASTWASTDTPPSGNAQ